MGARLRPSRMFGKNQARVRGLAAILDRVERERGRLDNRYCAEVAEEVPAGAPRFPLYLAG